MRFQKLIWHAVDEPNQRGCRFFLYFFMQFREIKMKHPFSTVAMGFGDTVCWRRVSFLHHTQKSSTLQGEIFFIRDLPPLLFSDSFFVTTQLRHQGSIFLSNQMDKRWHPLVAQCSTGIWHYPKLPPPPKGPKPTTTAKPTAKAVCVIRVKNMMVKIHVRINQCFNIRHCVWILRRFLGLAVQNNYPLHLWNTLPTASEQGQTVLLHQISHNLWYRIFMWKANVFKRSASLLWSLFSPTTNPSIISHPKMQPTYNHTPENLFICTMFLIVANVKWHNFGSAFSECATQRKSVLMLDNFWASRRNSTAANSNVIFLIPARWQNIFRHNLLPHYIP